MLSLYSTFSYTFEGMFIGFFYSSNYIGNITEEIKRKVSLLRLLDIPAVTVVTPAEVLSKLCPV